MAMNREQKRMLQRQGQLDAEGNPRAQRRQAPPQAVTREQRTSPGEYVREVRAEEAAQMALPLEDGVLKFHPVSTRVNSARDDDPGLILEVTEEKPEPVAARPKKAAGGGGQMDLF